ncbi:MAG: Spermine synthase [Solirubrobacterales bacterium]|jgi:spermidine synthase|nr:Spermine synthase [Solirubrobacterales bacterium]
MSDPLPASRGAQRRVQFVAFVVGASSLGSEIAAARLLAPYFGDSTLIWANTIATVLVALSVGYWIGGRAADRDPTLRGLCRLVMIAAALMAAVPFVAGPFLRTAVSAMDAIQAGAFVGSLIAVLVLIAVPVLLLGMASPYAVRLSVSDLDQAGTVTGRLYAISTLGSLTGTFLSALVMIPFLGTRRTFLVFALSLAAVAVVGLARRAVLAPAACLVLIALPVGTIKAASPGSRVLDEAETEYGYARVVQRPTGARWMELNEGQAIHSILPADRSYLTGDYWDEPLVLPFAGRPAADPPGRIAILGNAGGTIARAYGHFFPDTRVDAVEIDGKLTQMGRKWFDLTGPNLHTYTGDARPFLRASGARYDMILVDAYRQPYIPFYLTTREFFALCRDRLEPGGMVIINVGHPEDSHKLEQVLGRTLETSFAHVARDPSEPTNSMLVASNAPISADALDAAAGSLPAQLRPVARRAAARLAPRLPGGEVYTDDRAPVEWLIDASIIEVAESGTP